jgi:hypothetical protein
MRRRRWLWSVGVLAVGGGAAAWWESNREWGPTRDEFVRDLTPRLAAVESPDEADATIQNCSSLRFPNGEWVAGAGVDGHSRARARDTLVVRDSRGRVRAFAGGHVCGPRWIANKLRLDWTRYRSLADFYEGLALAGFVPYAPPAP